MSLEECILLDNTLALATPFAVKNPLELKVRKKNQNRAQLKNNYNN